MCGLVALLAQGGSWEQVALERATNALSHRGPDGSGRWVDRRAKVGLGHTRLSIIGLDNGAQPIASEDGRLHMVVNGEFYGYEAIRRDLEGRGHVFATESDSEIALHLYEEMGRECLTHLRGEFALVLWDEEQETLWAVRDRFGIKPMFYAQVGGVLYLASEVKALLAAGVPAAWDEETVFQQLFACFDARRALFAGVRQVPPGHYLVARGKTLRLERYWDVDYPRRGVGSEWEPEACIEHLGHLLKEAVRLRLRADVPMGCLLSGGLDSSTVLGLAAEAAAAPRAFTVAFDHASYDEEATARRTAFHLGAGFEAVPVSEADCADHFAETVWHAEALQANAHGVARFLLSRSLRRAGYKAVLAGEGADELFAGYGFCRSALLQGAGGGRPGWHRLVGALLRPRNPVERQVAQVSPWLVRTSRLLQLSPSVLAALGDKLEILRGMLAPDFLQRCGGRDPYRVFFDSFDYRTQLAGREPVKQILYLWLKSLFVNYNLAAERLDMAHGVEVRLPFLDHRLFEYGSHIPAALLAWEGRIKYPLREAARPHLTAEVYAASKKPFLAPPATLRVGNKLYELCQDILRGPGLAQLPFFDPRAVAALLDRLPLLDDRERTTLDPLILALTSLCVLQERYRL